MSFADHQDYLPEDAAPHEVEMTDAPIYPHTVQDGEIGRLRLACNACGKSVSSAFYPVATESGSGLLVRAWIECPECLEKRKQP